jgi:hypothetical protein
MAAAVLTVPLALLATASPASASVGGCSTDPLPGNSSVTVYTCAYISGSGRHVNYMDLHACVYGVAGAWVALAIYVPKTEGGGLWGVSRAYYRSHGNCTPDFYGPSGTVGAGPYTFDSVDYNSGADGGVAIGVVTLTVRS